MNFGQTRSFLITKIMIISFLRIIVTKQKKGKLLVGELKGSDLIDIKDVLELEYHLSYPYIFKEDDEIYLMPETGETIAWKYINV